MKEMEYQEKACYQLLEYGIYRDYHYIIESFGIYPCAHVQIPESSRLYGKDYTFIPVDCHGGLTSSTKFYMGGEILSGWWIRWDYAHPGDHIGGVHSGSKYSTEYMISEAKAVIDQLIELDASDTDKLFRLKESLEQIKSSLSNIENLYVTLLNENRRNK